MRRLFPLLLLPLIAACDTATLVDLGLVEEPEPEGPPPLPAAVAMALPPGTPASTVLQDASGCYLFTIEQTDPPSGYFIRGADGQPICEPAVAG